MKENSNGSVTYTDAERRYRALVQENKNLRERETLRDRFAMAAPASITNGVLEVPGISRELLMAQRAYRWADAMIQARAKETDK